MLDYKMTVKQLKALCKARGIKRYSQLRKAALIELLRAEDRLEATLNTYNTNQGTQEYFTSIEQLLLVPPSEFTEITQWIGVTQEPNEYIGEFYVRAWKAYVEYTSELKEAEKEATKALFEFNLREMNEATALLPTREANMWRRNINRTYGTKLIKPKEYEYYALGQGDGMFELPDGTKYRQVSCKAVRRFGVYNNEGEHTQTISCFSEQEIKMLKLMVAPDTSEIRLLSTESIPIVKEYEGWF